MSETVQPIKNLAYFCLDLEDEKSRFLAFNDVLYIYLKDQSIKLRLADGQFLQVARSYKSLAQFTAVPQFILYNPYLLVNKNLILSVIPEKDEIKLKFTENRSYQEDLKNDNTLIKDHELIFM